jgi:hypothetical protein
MEVYSEEQTKEQIEEVVEQAKLDENLNKLLREEWKPNKKQEMFLRLPFSIKEALFGGGAGSGKSDVLLMYGIVHKFHHNPKFKQVFMRRTHADMKKEIIQRSREIYRKLGATFNASDMMWTFPRLDQFGSGAKNDGAIIILGHCENESDVHMYDSAEISLFTPDELTNSTEYIYLYISQERNRSPKGSGLPSITRAAAMPGGVGHTFVNKRFVIPYPAGGKIIIGKGGNKRIYIHATLADNLDHIDPTYAQSLEGRPEAERKAKKLGDWSAYLGSVFEEFRTKKYKDEPDNALHVIEPFGIPHWWPKFICGDWGHRVMTYICFIAISPDFRVYVYRELYWTGIKIQEWAPVLRSFIEQEQPRIIKFCQSVSQNHGNEHTIREQIETAIGRPIELSVNSAGSRVAGKMLLHEYLRWKELPKISARNMPIYSEERARWILRNKGLEEYKAYLKIFEPPKIEDNIPKLQIFCCDESDHTNHPNCCPTLINSIQACSYDKPRNNKPAEDVAEFEGDDPYDTLRYAIETADSYLRDSSDEIQRLRKESDAMQRLALTGDVTSYYRNMRHAEANDHPVMISKFHGRRH